MIRLALVGLGKMGISHLALTRSHPKVELVAVCDSARYLIDALTKSIGIRGYTDYREMLRHETLDGVIIATPSRFHGEIVRAALDLDLHVFCEKPFCLDPLEGRRLAELARDKKLVNQVGYHYRFVGAFKHAKHLIGAGAIGRVHNVRAEAYGPVVLRTKNITWRTQKSEGGGCLYDYACHAIDLLTYLVGEPGKVTGSVLRSVFSTDVEDEVYSTLHFPNGATGQIAANWSDDSLRKMSVKISLWGTNGNMTVDRQEVRLYVRDPNVASVELKPGWTVSYTTDLSESPYFYLRGEEYSAQIDHFVEAISSGTVQTISTFLSANATDRLASLIISDAEQEPLPDTVLPVKTARRYPPRRLVRSRLAELLRPRRLET